MQSSPNGKGKKLTNLDQSSNYINYFVYFLKYRKFSATVFELMGLLATVQPIYYILNLHSYSITHFFLCKT